MQQAAAVQASAIPEFTEDLYDPVSLRDPFDQYRRLRDLGPLAWMPGLQAYALARFAEVQQALRAASVLVSGQGVGFNAIVNGPNDNRPTLESDGERHRKLRGLLNQSLLPPAIRGYRTEMTEIMTGIVAPLVDGDWFDAIDVLASALPLRIVSNLVGLPEFDRSSMLRWAAAGFNTGGPLEAPPHVAAQLEADFASLAEVRAFLREVDPAKLKPDSWTGKLFRNVAEAGLPESFARSAFSGFVLPSLDTTISASGTLLWCLARQPDQWEALRADPALAGSAVLEGMRYNSNVRWFARVAVEDYPVADQVIPAGSRVMILYQSANRDERRFADPDRFDVTRNPTEQLGWGTGPHMCAGMHLARMEMEVMLDVLTRHARTIELGEAELGENRGLYALKSLKLRLRS